MLQLFVVGDSLAAKAIERKNLQVFFSEALQLEQSCHSPQAPLEYATLKEYRHIKRSIISTLQYLGLNITSSALPFYARYFDFSERDYSNFVSNMIDNYCSKNISVISLKKLRKMLTDQFSAEKQKFKRPDVKDNTCFPPQLSEVNDKDSVYRQEFFWTIELFKSFCSWGNDIKDFRLLVPLVRHPGIMAFVIDQNINIQCKGIVCRRIDSQSFENSMPKSIGSSGLKSDFKRLYCQELKGVDYVLKIRTQKLPLK